MSSVLRKWLCVIIVLLGVGGVGLARNCHQFFAQPVVVQQAYVQPYYYPQVYYSVGQDLQIEALVDRKVRQIMEARQQVQQVKQQAQPVQEKPQYQQQELPASAPPAPGAEIAPAQNPNSAIVQHCKKCHSGAKPKGGVVLDGVAGLKCSQITAALRLIRDDKMPKDHAVDGPVKGQLMEELLALEIAQPVPAPAPVPAPPAPMLQGDLE